MTITQLLLLPAFAHVALVLTLVGRTAVGRVRAVRGRQTDPRKAALDNSLWPADLRKITNNYENQFELPVLYYAALALLLATGLTDAVAITLSWLFIATRFVHSYIQTHSNHLFHRFLAFASGVTVLLLLWAWFVLRLYVIG
ncbi:MAG: MAPEG family protein [Rhizobiales bacterium]|nr:MAPEG family protein [Hyphomicrobiales bacterium]MBI3672172.1 MAPEG family protein [Hyphomicrobiales bacterium]